MQGKQANLYVQGETTFFPSLIMICPFLALPILRPDKSYLLPKTWGSSFVTCLTDIYSLYSKGMSREYSVSPHKVTDVRKPYFPMMGHTSNKSW